MGKRKQNFAAARKISIKASALLLRLATVGCGCSRECGECASCGNLPPSAPEDERESCGAERESR